MIGDCPAAADHATTAGPFEIDTGDVPFALKQECSGGPDDWIGLAGTENGPLLEGIGIDTYGTSVSIVAARLWWRAFGPPTGTATAEVVAYNTNGTAATWAQPDTNSIWDTTAGPQELTFPASDNVELLRIGERCARPYGTSVTSCPTENQFQYEGLPLVVQLYGAELTLSDATPPTITLTSGPEGEAPITSSIDLSFTASDPVGLTKSELLVDGTPVATHEYTSGCSYTQLRPCPESESDQLSVEGASLPEGTHQLAVRVTDAAGNSAVSSARTVVSARPPIPNGDPCPTPAISLTLSRPSPLPFDAAAAVEGRLACGATAIPGAKVEIESSTLAGASPVDLGSVVTDKDGSFGYQIPTGPSRKLTCAYFANSDQSTPAAQEPIKIAVEPRITLVISPRRTHNLGTIKWTGQIAGGPYPTAGVPLLTQVLNVTLHRVLTHDGWKTVRRKEWLTFAETVAHDGKIKFAHTFTRTFHPTTYTFRIATPAGGDDAGYEYTSGVSNQVSVRVR